VSFDKGREVTQMDWTFKVDRMTVLDQPAKSTLAFADLVINDGLKIKGFTVCSGDNGPFVGVPSEIGKDQKWYEQVEFFDKRVKKQMVDAVLKEYEAKTVKV
jgi:DNA-binding cell septation regulator SpoVG